MNTEDIIRMARQAGMREPGPMSQDSKRFYPNDFAERFAALVNATAKIEMLEAGNDKWLEEARRQEREACAKVCESLPMQQEIDVRDECAAAIRARSQS